MKNPAVIAELESSVERLGYHRWVIATESHVDIALSSDVDRELARKVANDLTDMMGFKVSVEVGSMSHSPWVALHGKMPGVQCH